MLIFLYFFNKKFRFFSRSKLTQDSKSNSPNSTLTETLFTNVTEMPSHELRNQISDSNIESNIHPLSFDPGKYLDDPDSFIESYAQPVSQFWLNHGFNTM